MTRIEPVSARDSGSAVRPVAERIVDILACSGIREVFGLAGGALTPLMGALAGQDVLRYTGVRHEAAAAQMAAAVNQATGRLAVCLGEQGPGTLNLVSGLGGARNNNLAVLALTVSGSAETAGPGSGALMELDAVAASRAVTKWARAVRSAGEIPDVIREAIVRAQSGRPGPVHVDVPRDVLATSVEGPEREAAAEPVPLVLPSADRLAAAVEALLAAERPLVIAGGGAARSGAGHGLRRIAERLGALTATTQMGLGVLPSDGVAFVGQGGVIAGPALIRATEEADVILAVGCRFSSWWWREGRRLGRQARVIRIDTADLDPAPDDILLIGDAATVTNEILSRLAGRPPRPTGAWAHDLRHEYLRHRARLDELASDTGRPAHPAALARAVGALLEHDDLVVLDGGHTSFWGNDFVPARHPRTVLHEPGMAQLGFGLPYANALALTHPGRQVVTITGDGAFGFSVAELDTARRYGLSTITVIHNNAAWGVIGLAQRGAGFTLGTDLAGTDYAAIATGFGCLGIRVDELAALPDALAAARAARTPAVLDVRVRFEPHPMMPAFGRTTAAPVER